MEKMTRLAALIEASDLTAEEIANKAGVTLWRLNKYAKGERVPRGADLYNLAIVLQVDRDAIREPGLRWNHRNDQASNLRKLVAKRQTPREKHGFCTIIMATCPEDGDERDGCQLGELAKKYLERSQAIDRQYADQIIQGRR